MKNRYWLLFPVRLLSSCRKDSTMPFENITPGAKWNLQTGNAPAQVYAQLQEPEKEKGFFGTAAMQSKGYTNPQSLQAILPYYNAVGLQRAVARDRHL